MEPTEDQPMQDMEKQLEPQPAAKRTMPLLGVRHLQCLLMFLGMLVAYALRVDLSVGIVAMVDNTDNPDFEAYDWDETTRANILSSFFWGYVVTQVPAGQLAERFGPRYLLLGSLLICSVLTLLTPLAAREGDWGLVVGFRVLMGLSQGFVFPCTHTLLAKWAPVEERGRLVTYVYAGSQVGTILAMSTSGVLATSAGGWPSIFYVFGGLGLCWAVLWFFLGADRPATHSFISAEERQYIEQSLGADSSDMSERKPKTPWKSLLTSLPMWSLIIVHCGQNWGFWTLLTEMPTYMSSVLHFNIKDNSLLSALPYLVMWLLSFVFSFLADHINKRRLLPLGVSRKLFNSIGHWIPGLAMIALGFSSDATTAVTLLTVAVAFNSATYVGYQVNHIDISPNFAGTLMGITNGAANIFSFVGPQVVGVIVPDLTSQSQWRVVFFITAAVYFANNLVFVLFGQATVQSWNEPTYSSDSTKTPADGTEEQEGKK